MKSPVYHEAASFTVVLACVVALSGCCRVTPPINSPTWIAPTTLGPTARACTQFDNEMTHQMRELKHKLERGRHCCGNDEPCKEVLGSRGTAAWDHSLATYQLVHTNLPAGDKIDSLKRNQSLIDDLHVCGSGTAK
jgi:hypothetical protein